MSPLKQKLAAGERVTVYALGRTSHPNMVEMYGLHGGFDGFWIDCEHADFSTRELEVLTSTARSSGQDCFARIAPTDYAIVTRCLESGCSGVMAAMINTPAEAERIVRWAKFAPRGERGLNSGGYDGDFGLKPMDKFCQEANANTFIAIQVETLPSVDCCEELISIPDVDLLFIGPADLSQALGIPGQLMDKRCIAAIEKVAKACAKHNKPFGAVTTTPEHAKMLLDFGCRMISPTNDVRTINLGIQSVKAKFPDIFGA